MNPQVPDRTLHAAWKLLDAEREATKQLRAELAAAKAEIELNEINLGLAVDYQKQLISDFHAERTELKQQLAAAKAEIEKWKLMYQHESVVSFKRWEHLDEQLAARDLVISKMKDAINRQPYTMDKEVCEALALQPTQEALDAYVQEQLRAIISQNVIEVQKDVAEQDKLDAKRYRWLRESNWFSAGIVHEAPYGRTAHDSWEHLDAAIDRAMENGK